MFLTKEKGLQRQLQNAEKLRQQLEAERQLAQIHAARKDKILECQATYERQVQILGESIYYSQKQAATDLINGLPVSQIGVRIAGADALEKYLEAIKAELRLQIVGPAEKSLADFERDNAKELQKLPKLRKASEPEFIAPKNVNEWDAPALTPLQVAAGDARGAMAEAD